MKAKKLKEFVKALYTLNIRKPEEVYTVDTGIRYNYANGEKSPSLRGIIMQGKYMLPEVDTINKIIKSIEPTKIRKEAIRLNQMYGFPLMLINTGAPEGLASRKMILTINTKHGILLYDVVFNNLEDVPSPFSDDEIQALRKIAPDLIQNKLAEDITNTKEVSANVDQQNQ